MKLLPLVLIALAFTSQPVRADEAQLQNSIKQAMEFTANEAASLNDGQALFSAQAWEGFVRANQISGLVDNAGSPRQSVAVKFCGASEKVKCYGKQEGFCYKTPGLITYTNPKNNATRDFSATIVTRQTKDTLDAPFEQVMVAPSGEDFTAGCGKKE